MIAPIRAGGVHLRARRGQADKARCAAFLPLIALITVRRYPPLCVSWWRHAPLPVLSFKRSRVRIWRFCHLERVLRAF